LISAIEEGYAEHNGNVDATFAHHTVPQEKVMKIYSSSTAPNPRSRLSRREGQRFHRVVFPDQFPQEL